MSLLIMVAVVTAVVAYRAGRLHQSYTQARIDAGDARRKFWRAWRGQWSAGAAAATGWLLLGLCAVLAAFALWR